MEKGIIKSFNETSREGTVLADNGNKLTFSMKGCNKIVAGALTPEFYGHFGAVPKIGDKIRFVRRFGNVAFTWGYEAYFAKAEQEIANRPIYRVMAKNRFDGQMMAGDRRLEEVVRGTVQAIEAEYPRLLVGDRLAPVYTVLKCRAEQSWQVCADGGVWLECQDPRRKPFGLLYRVMRFDGAKSVELGRGTPYELQMQSARGSEGDKFAQTDIGEGKGYTYFLLKKESEWKEVGDPRPEPKVKCAMPKVLRNTVLA
ncbi:MAG: hypothetical protein RLZZ347_852 [Candidatus Parcubacteria bacterium]|jgi:hypothetical protein